MYRIFWTDIHINFVGLYQIIFNILTAWVYMHRLGWKLNVHAAYVHYEDQDIHNIRKLLVCFGTFWDSLAWFNHGKRQRPPYK